MIVSLALDNEPVVYLFLLNLTDKLFQNNKFIFPFKYLWLYIAQFLK